MKLNISAVTEGWGPGQTGGIEIDRHCGWGGVKRRWMGLRFCEVMTGWGPRSGRGGLGAQAPGGGGGGGACSQELVHAVVRVKLR